MGCFCSRPEAEVTENPSVVLHAEVGACAVKGFLSNRMLNVRCSGGILYVQNGMLCHVTKCGSSVYQSVFEDTWSLMEIQEIRVVNDERVWLLAGRSMHVLSLCPGIKIKLKGGVFGGTDTLLAEMPDAVTFAQRLRDHIGGVAPVPLFHQL